MNLAQLTAMYDFTGKTFVVTGGTGVLGGEVACALAGCGATVVILNRSLSPAAGVVDYETKQGCRVKAVAGDVMDRESLVRAAEAIQERFGSVYGLVNAAGGNRPTAITSADLSFFDIPEEALRFVLDLNLLGTILPCQVFGRQMAAAGEGVILNFSSMAAYRPLTNVVAYAAAKAGITNFTAWLAVHMAQHYSGKIRVNAVAPGFFLGEQNRDLLVDRETGNLTPRGRLVIDHTPVSYTHL
ncbi:MAG: SDR family NAD(P)-dependent oxidoreductase, partial [Caldilineales bacterium]|nr:SDR family NAD(P)-dependent oxidoreductase [Caldilineales bacterium]